VSDLYATELPANFPEITRSGGALNHVARFLAFVLCLSLPVWAQDPAILQLRVVQGEGAVYPTGSRATRGVIVRITDETGKAVEGATVTFRLPEQGPTGEFSSGKRSEVVNTGADGTAEAWGMQWGREAGSFELRVTAAKGAARGGVLCPLHLSDAPALKSESAAPQKIGGGKKKLWIALGLAAGATAAVIGVAGTKVPAAIAPGTVESVTIGAPTITIGRP